MVFKPALRDHQAQFDSNVALDTSDKVFRRAGYLVNMLQTGSEQNLQNQHDQPPSKPSSSLGPYPRRNFKVVLDIKHLTLR